MRNLNQLGMSLIQVVVAMALLALVALGVATVSQQINALNQNTRAQHGRSSLQNVLQKVFSEKQLCDNFINSGADVNLPTPTSPGVTQLTIDLHDGAPGNTTIIGSGAVLQKFDVILAPNDLSFSIPAGSAGTASVAPLPPGTLWTGLVELRLQKLGAESAGGTGLQTKVLGALTLLVNGANQIMQCESFTVDGAQACASLGGTWTGTVCNFPYVYPCIAGQIVVGPNTPLDCKSCAANEVLVFGGVGGFTCLPYP